MSSNIPDNYKGLGYGSIHGESKIRSAIAIAEVQKAISSASNGSEALPGNDATLATSVQGITGGKAIAVAGTVIC